MKLCLVFPLLCGIDLDSTELPSPPNPTQTPVCFLKYTFSIFHICFLTLPIFNSHLLSVTCLNVNMHTNTSPYLPSSVIILSSPIKYSLSSSVTCSCRNLFYEHQALIWSKQAKAGPAWKILALSTSDRPQAVVKATDILHSLALLPPPMAVH